MREREILSLSFVVSFRSKYNVANGKQNVETLHSVGRVGGGEEKGGMGES